MKDIMTIILIAMVGMIPVVLFVNGLLVLQAYDDCKNTKWFYIDRWEDVPSQDKITTVVFYELGIRLGCKLSKD